MIVQCKGYRIMKPSALKWISIHLTITIQFCLHAVTWERKGWLEIYFYHRLKDWIHFIQRWTDRLARNQNWPILGVTARTEREELNILCFFPNLCALLSFHLSVRLSTVFCCHIQLKYEASDRHNHILK